MAHRFILPALMAAWLILLPIYNKNKPIIYISLTQEEYESNLNYWFYRLRCDKYHSETKQNQCYECAVHQMNETLQKRK